MSTFWTKDPSILFKSEYIFQLYPLSSMSPEEKLNAITRLVILLTILGYLITKQIWFRLVNSHFVTRE